MTKERPLLMSTPMVVSTMKLIKTMTRRIIKDKRVLEGLARGENPSFFEKGWCPYGEVGDILWVRETWSGEEQDFGPDRIIYKAGSIHPELHTWRPSIFMPKSACRNYLEITEIRIERIQDISEEDAIREGVEKIEGLAGTFYKSYQRINATSFITAAWSFRTLWESINGIDSFQENPWVWVISYKKIEKL